MAAPPPAETEIPFQFQFGRCRIKNHRIPRLLFHLPVCLVRQKHGSRKAERLEISDRPVWSRCEWVMKRYSALATCSAVRSGTRSSPSVEVPASTIKAWRPPSTKKQLRPKSPQPPAIVICISISIDVILQLSATHGCTQYTIFQKKPQNYLEPAAIRAQITPAMAKMMYAARS